MASVATPRGRLGTIVDWVGALTHSDTQLLHEVRATGAASRSVSRLCMGRFGSRGGTRSRWWRRYVHI